MSNSASHSSCKYCSLVITKPTGITWMSNIGQVHSPIVSLLVSQSQQSWVYLHAQFMWHSFSGSEDLLGVTTSIADYLGARYTAYVWDLPRRLALALFLYLLVHPWLTQQRLVDIVVFDFLFFFGGTACFRFALVHRSHYGSYFSQFS